MTSYQILDSSPIHIPSHAEVHPRPLKRSASLASLPTPPRTHCGRSRSGAVSAASRHALDDSSSASEPKDDPCGGHAARTAERHSKIWDETSGDKSGRGPMGGKKRRITVAPPAHEEDEDEEDAFWTGLSGGTAPNGRKQSSAAEDTAGDGESPAPALPKYRVRVPVSPPPSRRAPQVQPRASSVQRSRSPPPALLLPKSPVTPPRKLFLRAPPSPSNSTAKKIWPTRDSPDNPFLAGEGEKSTYKVSSWESSEDALPVREALERTPTPAPAFEEKPTITYVFRGQKATFRNPQYHVAPEVLEASKLPMDHPDFEVAEACVPRRLFSKPQGSDKGPERLELLRHAREEREHREKDSKQRLAAKDGLRAGAFIVERDNPVRRAMGPARCS